MNILIFKTDIKSTKSESEIRPIFNHNKTITKWTIDKKDIDNVLRIEAEESLTEKDIINLMKSSGFSCEILND